MIVFLLGTKQAKENAMKSKNPILHTLSALALTGALLAGCNRAEQGGGAEGQETPAQEGSQEETQQGTGLGEEGTGAGGAGMDTLEGMDTGMGLPGGTGTGGAGQDTLGTGIPDTSATGTGGGSFPGDTASLDTMGPEPGM